MFRETWFRKYIAEEGHPMLGTSESPDDKIHVPLSEHVTNGLYQSSNMVLFSVDIESDKQPHSREYTRRVRISSNQGASTPKEISDILDQEGFVVEKSE